jgi:hypothetical protein
VTHKQNQKHTSLSSALVVQQRAAVLRPDSFPDHQTPNFPITTIALEVKNWSGAKGALTLAVAS